MNFSQKIKLENSIFARADKVYAHVHARAGLLISSSKDECLQTLLALYNMFFYKENWENFCAQENSLESFWGFETSIAHTPVFSTKDYKFELIVGGKDA